MTRHSRTRLGERHRRKNWRAGVQTGMHLEDVSFTSQKIEVTVDNGVSMAVTAARFSITIDGYELASFSALGGITTSVEVVDFINTTSDKEIVINEQPGTSTLTHAGENVERIVGGPESDSFDITPSTTLVLTIDGGGGTERNVLNYDALGLVATQTATTLSVPGYQTVTFVEIDTVNVLNASSLILAAFLSAGSTP